MRGCEAEGARMCCGSVQVLQDSAEGQGVATEGAESTHPARNHMLQQEEGLPGVGMCGLLRVLPSGGRRKRQGAAVAA